MEVKSMSWGLMYSEGRFRLEVNKSTGSMFSYHDCPATGVAPDILTKDEVVDDKCMYCGKLDMPENLRAMYILYNFNKIQEETNG